jgi:HK97 family phage portal protein
MFDRLKAYLAAPEAKASRTANLLAFGQGRARWTTRNYQGLAQEGFVGNAIVHRAVRLIAENAAACAFLVFEGAREHEAHPLSQLLTRPNPRQDGGVFFETLYAHLLLAGNAYVEAVALDDAVRELHALRPDRIKLIPGADGWAEAYEYSVGGRSVRFDQQASRVPPILHLTFFHPLDDHYGLAPIEAAATALDTHNAAAKWNKALLDNAARPSGALGRKDRCCRTRISSG